MGIGQIPIQAHASNESHLPKLRGNGWQFPSIGPHWRLFGNYYKLGAYARYANMWGGALNKKSEQKPGFKRLFKTSVGIICRVVWVRFLASWTLISVVPSEGSLRIRHGFCLRLVSDMC